MLVYILKTRSQARHLYRFIHSFIHIHNTSSRYVYIEYTFTHISKYIFIHIHSFINETYIYMYIYIFTYMTIFTFYTYVYLKMFILIFISIYAKDVYT